MSPLSGNDMDTLLTNAQHASYADYVQRGMAVYLEDRLIPNDNGQALAKFVRGIAGLRKADAELCTACFSIIYPPIPPVLAPETLAAIDAKQGINQVLAKSKSKSTDVKPTGAYQIVRSLKDNRIGELIESAWNLTDGQMMHRVFFLDNRATEFVSPNDIVVLLEVDELKLLAAEILRDQTGAAE